MEYSNGGPCQSLDFIIWNNHCSLYMEYYVLLPCQFLDFIIWNFVMLDYHPNNLDFIIWNNSCALYMEYTLIMDFWHRDSRWWIWLIWRTRNDSDNLCVRIRYNKRITCKLNRPLYFLFSFFNWSFSQKRFSIFVTSNARNIFSLPTHKRPFILRAFVHQMHHYYSW